jgi:sigma-B regulation protein RsbU (phosphoserine phosphatase)
MTDRSITIKAFSRKLAPSLAWRVLVGSLALLGLPLLIHTFFLYRREYRENVHDTFQSLQYLAEGRVLYLEEMIQNEQNILTAIESELPAAPEERTVFLNREAPEYGLDAILYIEPGNAPRSFLAEAAKKDKFVFIEGTSLYVGKTLASGALFVVKTELSPLLSRLAHLDDNPYPVRLSLVDQPGEVVFFSTQPVTETMAWERYPEIAHAWFMKSSEGTFLSVGPPIEGTPYLLLLDVPERSIVELQVQDYFYRIATFLFFVCLLGGGILFFFTRRVARPLRALGDCMHRVGEGATHARFKPDRMGFEINVLGLQMNQMLDAMLEQAQEVEKERIARERLAQELKIGHQIQASMLPLIMPIPTLDIAPGYLAAREVSGDFYDLFMLEDGRLLIAIADAADKGISACLYSLSFRSMLRTAAALETDLASIVRISNSILMRDTAETSFFITAFIGLYDPKTRELSYTCQGHPPAIIRKKEGRLIELSRSGIALGLEEVEPKIETITLDRHDLLFLYTDGVIEAHDLDGQLFGKKRLMEFLERARQNSAAAIIDQLLEEVHLFARGTPQADDLTVLALRTT